MAALRWRSRTCHRWSAPSELALLGPQAAGEAPAEELDDAEIERSIREINEAIKRSSHKKP